MSPVLTAGAPPAIQCSVDVENKSGGVALRGRILSSVAARGTCRLDVVKMSPSGSSNISQSTTFRAQADEPLFVGMAFVDMGPDTRITARFTAQAEGQDRPCRAEKDISSD